MLMGIESDALVMMALAMAGAGAVAGTLAGVFGVGGGAVLVPILLALFDLLAVPDTVQMHLAIGTSLAIIVPTAARSYRAHARRGGADRTILASWVIWVPLGVAAAGAFASGASGQVLQLIFAVVAAAMAAQMLFGRDGWRLARDVLVAPWREMIGFGIGAISGVMGIGGGNLNNTVMSLSGRSMHEAVATSAGLGVLIAVPGVLTYAVIGWGHADLPPFSMGYVNVAAAAAILPLALLCAPLGARLAHGLTDRQMKRLFGGFLMLVSLRFAMAAFGV